LRFLLVDDNAVNLMVAKLVLLKYWPTAQVTTATSGEQALALLEQQHFDVVLMDMVMPGMDGLEATRHVRMHPRSDIASLVVIGLTANATPRDKERCLESGMNDVLVKPMEPVLVQSTISHWVKPMLDRRQQRSMP
jgi:CheY-like chemotaxis protein